jgi:hypothetical protein
MFAFVAVAHVALIAFGIVRMRVRPAETRTGYVYVPRTSFLIGRLLGRKPLAGGGRDGPGEPPR